MRIICTMQHNKGASFDSYVDFIFGFPGLNLVCPLIFMFFSFLCIFACSKNYEVFAWLELCFSVAAALWQEGSAWSCSSENWWGNCTYPNSDWFVLCQGWLSLWYLILFVCQNNQQGWLNLRYLPTLVF